MKKPVLEFSRWIAWERRSKYGGGKWPGVYMLSISRKKLVGGKPAFKDVVYIGMTNSRGGLAVRWDQFDNAIKGKEGHSGGKTVFKDLGHFKKWKKRLFVTACPVRCNVFKSNRTPKDLLKMGWVVFLEYEALSKYKKIVGMEPKYNTK